MPGHDDLEIAIEQRRYGALDPEGAARLNEHLASCSDCRAFATFTTHTEDEMRQQAAAAITYMDWARISRGIAGWRAEIRRRPWRGLLQTIAMFPAMWLLFGVNAIWPTIGALIGHELYRRRVRRSLAEMRHAETWRPALLVLYQRQLDREIVEHRRVIFIVPIALGAIAVWILFRPRLTVQLVIAAALALAAVCECAWVVWIKLPRLRRERAALE
jgi:hypothetical protein